MNPNPTSSGSDYLLTGPEQINRFQPLLSNNTITAHDELPNYQSIDLLEDQDSAGNVNESQQMLNVASPPSSPLTTELVNNSSQQLQYELPPPVTASTRQLETPGARRQRIWRRISSAIGLTVPEVVIDALCNHWTTFLLISGVLVVLLTFFLYYTGNIAVLISIWRRLLCILGILPCANG